MIDIEHKVLKSIQNNFGNLPAFLEDTELLKIITDEKKEIDSWDEEKKVELHKIMAEDVLNNYDINVIMEALRNLITRDDKTIMMFTAVAERFYSFLQKLYDVYLIDQIYYILVSNIDYATCNFDTPFKTGSALEITNFELFPSQVSMMPVASKNNVGIKLYWFKRAYEKQIGKLLNSSGYQKRYELLYQRLLQIMQKGDNPYALNLLVILCEQCALEDNIPEKHTFIEPDPDNITIDGFKL